MTIDFGSDDTVDITLQPLNFSNYVLRIMLIIL